MSSRSAARLRSASRASGDIAIDSQPGLPSRPSGRGRRRTSRPRTRRTPRRNLRLGTTRPQSPSGRLSLHVNPDAITTASTIPKAADGFATGRFSRGKFTPRSVTGKPRVSANVDAVPIRCLWRRVRPDTSWSSSRLLPSTAGQARVARRGHGPSLLWCCTPGLGTGA